jgi:amidase
VSDGGRLRPPDPGQIARYAADLNLPLPLDEVEDNIAHVTALLRTFDRLAELPEPMEAPRHRTRDAGRAPTAMEDPYNAILRWCEITGAEDGPLLGRRIGVKDCIAVAGVPMTVGGRRMPVAVPAEDAVVIERLLDAGAVIAAKTNMADMALGLGETSAFGPTTNPRGADYSSGGSSSGSAAAVAGGLVDAALGTDQAGSIRIPSAWCGVVGMKPTHGLVSTHGLVHMEHTLDHVGPITRTVQENAAMLECMAGNDWRSPHPVAGMSPEAPYASAAARGIQGLRIGVLADSLDPAGCTADVLEAFEQARGILAALGAEIVSVEVPLWTEAAGIWLGVAAFGLASMARTVGYGFGHPGRIDVDLATTLAAQHRLGAADLPVTLRTMLLAASHLFEEHYGAHFGRAQNLRLELGRQVDRALAGVDVLITPTTPAGPVKAPSWPMDDLGLMAYYESIGADLIANTCPLDLSGHPALTVPAIPDSDGFLAGLQIIGRRFDEYAVYRAAFAFERELAG